MEFLPGGHKGTIPRVSVIIVHFETPALLDGCLAALASSSGDVALEVIVIDNASRNFDRSAFTHHFPSVELIENATNVGFAAASNQGLRRARGEFVLLLNPDTAVQPDTLAKMLELMDERPDIGCATARLVLPDGRLDAACRRLFPTPARAFFRLTQLSRIFPRSRRFGQYNLSYLDPQADTEIDAPAGAFMFVRRTVCDQVGLLDERYFMYGEDLDWAFRMKAAGWRIFYTARTSVWHQKRASSRQDRPANIRHFHEAMRIFYRDHYAAQYPRPVSWLILAAIRAHEFVELTAERLWPQAGHAARKSVAASRSSV